MIQTVLADDELLARQKLRQMLQEEPMVEIVGESASAAETVELVRMTKPDLLFLDIRMPGRDGFAVIEEISARVGPSMPVVIFTTAYDNYALRAFDIHAADYLLKPFSCERLKSAIEKANQQLVSRQNRLTEPGSRKNGNEPRYAMRIAFKSRGRIVFLPVANIVWVGAEENYVRLTTETESHLIRGPIARMEEKLDPEMFLRVHRSSIVNLTYVKEVRTEANGESVVVLMNGQKLPMSRSYKSRINEWLMHT